MGRYADSVSRILLEQGRAKAQGQLGSGQAWGHFAEQLGQIPAQLADQRAQQQQLQQKQEAQAQERDLRQQQIRQGQQQIDQAQVGIDERKHKAFTSQQIHDAAEQAYGQIKDGNAEAVLGLLPPESRVMAEGWLGSVAKAKQERDAQGIALGKQTAQFIQANGYDPVTSATALRVLADVHPGAKDAFEHVANPESFKKLIDHFATLGDKPEAPFTLGENQTRFGPDGAVLAQGPPKAAAEPATIEAMLVQAIKAKDGPRVRELLNMKKDVAAAGRTPAAGPAPPSDYTLGGGRFSGVTNQQIASAPAASEAGAPLSAIQRDELAVMDTVQAMGGKLMDLGTSTNWSGTGGMGKGTVAQFMAKNFGAGTPEGQELRSYVGQIKGSIAKLRGGTSFTPNEQTLLDTYTPGIDDHPMVIKSKVKSLNEFIDAKRSAVKGPVAAAKAQEARTAPPAAATGPAIGSTVTFNGKKYKVAGITNGQADLEPL